VGASLDSTLVHASEMAADCCGAYCSLQVTWWFDFFPTLCLRGKYWIYLAPSRLRMHLLSRSLVFDFGATGRPVEVYPMGMVFTFRQVEEKFGVPP
jgi:hypothetical protein